MSPDLKYTLFLPVIARAFESKKANPLFTDSIALEIIDRFSIDIPDRTSTFDELCSIAFIVRYSRFERVIRDFIRRYPYGTIVNIGCGLDSTYERVNNGFLHWYDLDLPDVIGLRKLFMNETGNRKFIAGSFLDNNWYRHINCPDHILFVAGGIYCYYEEKNIIAFFRRLSRMYPSGELLFDVMSAAGAWVTNRILLNRGLDEKQLLKWGLKNVNSLLCWSPKLRLLGRYHIYKNAGVPMSIKIRILGWIYTALDIQYIMHIKIKADYKHLSFSHLRNHILKFLLWQGLFLFYYYYY